MRYLITENQRDKAALKWMNNKFSPDQLNIVTSQKYPNSIFYFKDGKFAMQQNNKSNNFYFDFSTIWSILEDVFGYDYDEIQSILQDWLEHTLKLEGFTPYHKMEYTKKHLEQTLKQSN